MQIRVANPRFTFLFSSRMEMGNNNIEKIPANAMGTRKGLAVTRKIYARLIKSRIACNYSPIKL